MKISLNAPRISGSRLAAMCLALVTSLTLSAPASAAEYAVDSVHSSALFKVKHFDVAYFYGTFRDLEGTIVYDENDPSKSSIELVIDANSVDTRNSNRDDHVKSPDFLNAKQFPKITFESTQVKPLANGDLEVTGDLTLLGVKQPITITAEKTGQGTNPRSNKEMVGFHTEFTVDRTEHDMNFMVGPLSEEITLILSLEALKN